MASIEQKLIGNEHTCVHVNNLHVFQFEIRAFIKNKCIKTKTIRAQRCRNRTTKFQKRSAVDLIRYIFMMEIFWNFIEPILPFFLRNNRLLRSNPKKIW